MGSPAASTSAVASVAILFPNLVRPATFQVAFDEDYNIPREVKSLLSLNHDLVLLFAGRRLIA
jgi:hypothetical protein